LLRASLDSIVFEREERDGTLGVTVMGMELPD
jgi:hypothetical protein